jgi:hypothetical protein
MCAGLVHPSISQLESQNHGSHLPMAEVLSITFRYIQIKNTVFSITTVAIREFESDRIQEGGTGIGMT